MKKKLTLTALILCMVGGLSSCKDDAPASDSEPKEVDLKEVVATVAQDEEDASPKESEVRAQLLPMLADFPAINVERVMLDASPAEDGTVMVAARVQVRVGENLFEREDAPAVFNAERRAVNDALNRAMMPEAHYMLQVGAEAEEITDDDRSAYPLPDELKQQADALKSLAESPVYRLRTPAQTVVELAAELKAQRNEGHWVYSNVHFDTAPLRTLVALMPESSLPQGVAVVNDGFEARRIAELREKIEAFNKAAEPIIAAREDAARKRVLEQRSHTEETAKAEADRIALKAASRERWDKLCSSVMKDSSAFTGEWKRGDDFGKLSLRISKVQNFAESVQFTGVIFDPDMPQAELQVVGRFEQPERADELVPLTIHIYHGRYNPDEPTAEAYDAKDAMLRLKMAEDGSSQGVLTCAAWQDTPEKDFLVNFSHTPRKNTPARRAHSAKPAAPRR